MARGIEPSLEQVSAMSEEFERILEDTPRTPAAACTTTGNDESSGQDDVEGNVEKYTPALRAYSHDRGLSRMEAYATTGSTQGKESRHEVDLGDIPRLPCAPARPKDRVKQPTHGPYLQACVARPVTRKECEANPTARAAMQSEWDRLRAVPRPDGNKGTWDEHGVREWVTQYDGKRA